MAGIRSSQRLYIQLEYKAAKQKIGDEGTETNRHANDGKLQKINADRSARRLAQRSENHHGNGFKRQGCNTHHRRNDDANDDKSWILFAFFVAHHFTDTIKYLPH